MDISSIDKNFIVNTNINKEDVVFYNAEDTSKFKLYGLFREGELLRRIPEEVARATNDGVYNLHARAAGGRVRFVTDSPYVALYAKYGVASKMPHFAFTASMGFDLYSEEKYIKTFIPPVNTDNLYTGVVDIPASLHTYTLNLPLYSSLTELHIGVKEGSRIEPAADYTYTTPIVYYGSSITQGGCASRPGTSYQSIISRRFDTDYVNLGFSGSARGEDSIVDYIAGLNMSIFVCDYDHNAPTYEHLEATHEKLYRKVRALRPDLPIIMVSRPNYYRRVDELRRADLIRANYEKAVSEGDKNVYHVDGADMIGADIADIAHVDGTHPNDVGFAAMAKVIGDTIAKILKK